MAPNPTLPPPGILLGLPPVLPPRPGLLVLGSMPGEASLNRRQYYAHPRNAFWPIMAALLGGDANAPYRQRCLMLKRAGVALWDVIGACRRRGSLDSAIAKGSERINDIAGLARRRPGIRTIALNGATAHALYQRHVRHAMPTPGPEILRLPSTSPANAAMTLEEKTKAWRQALAPRAAGAGRNV